MGIKASHIRLNATYWLIVMLEKKRPHRARLKDVAEKAGVSLTTVSLVIKNPDTSRVSKTTSQKVLRIAKELNYRPNYSARTLVTKKSGTIGMILPSLMNPHYAEIASCIVERARDVGYSIILSTAPFGLESERRALDDLINRGCDGVIICSVLLDDPVVEEFASYQIPFITLIRTIRDDPSKPPMDSVSVDNSRGSFLAIEHLIKLGHSRIAILVGDINTSTGYNRLQGALSALAAHGIEYDDSLIFHGGDFLRATGYKLTEKLLAIEPLPTAIFAQSDHMAVGAIECLSNQGVKVPEDIAIVGFDDTEMAGLPGIDLTSISQSIKIMGEQAIDLLIGKIQGKTESGTKRILLDPILVQRKTCSK